MDERETVHSKFMASLLAYQRDAERNRECGKVLPADVDLDAELLARLDEIAE